MKNYWYYNTISDFQKETIGEILSQIATGSGSDIEQTQFDAWRFEIERLQTQLGGVQGEIYFEFTVPRIGKRIDVVVLVHGVLFILEFKVHQNAVDKSALDQVWDYALDLHHFHDQSQNAVIVPILLTSHSDRHQGKIEYKIEAGNILRPIKCHVDSLKDVIKTINLQFPAADLPNWKDGKYHPSPTIIEAAKALYKNHSVDSITRHEASAKNLSRTSKKVLEIIDYSQKNNRKSICFVTGVPGSGKTLVGLDIAGKRMSGNTEDGKSVFLSGNGPLVSVLCESLVEDRSLEYKKQGVKKPKTEIRREVSKIIQNVHHYRDAYLKDLSAPYDHVAIFDEAQRAWNLQQTKNFMLRRKRIPNFSQSEPEFLISCLDRHKDWAVIICLVGNGQEINTGEAGITEWLKAIHQHFKEWDIYLPTALATYEAGVKDIITDHQLSSRIRNSEDLHLTVSLRSFRSEKVSDFVTHILERKQDDARSILSDINNKFPIYLTRDIAKAKQWLKANARGTERYGIVVSSQAERLKPHAMDVRSPIDPVLWFLKGNDDIRSSLFLEDVATEFHVQGLELDWVCVTWDADFRYGYEKWNNHSFRGNKWMNINSAERVRYQKNAYRVLLTRARKGMVIVVPEGDSDDHTRKNEFYDPTYQYLKSIGINELS